VGEAVEVAGEAERRRRIRRRGDRAARTTGGGRRSGRWGRRPSCCWRGVSPPRGRILHM